MSRARRAGLLAAVALCTALPAPMPARAAGRGSGLLAEARTVLPEAAPSAAVLLFSDGAWGAEARETLRVLRAAGAAVIGVDTTALIARIEAAEEDCVYVIDRLEALAKDLQRGAGGGTYHQPLLAGAGAGGAMALALMAQTPPGTVAGALAADPATGIALHRPLCTAAARRLEGGVTVYGLSATPLPAPIGIIQTAAATISGRAQSAALQAGHPDIVITSLPDTGPKTPPKPGPDAGPVPAPAGAQAADPAPPKAADALRTALLDRTRAEDDGPLHLPLTLLPAEPLHDTLAVIYSGDGGWRDIDKQIGAALQAGGVPVVGVDALRYFWSERSAEETAADLSRILAAYRAQWGVSNIVLIGYSFGADVLGAAYNRLPEADRAAVRLISLLGLSRNTAWEISVSGWLGQAGDGPSTLAEIDRIDPALLQCVHGAEEADSPCPDLAARGAEVIRTAGGHHFDGDYPALARMVLDGIERRAP